MDLKHGIEAWTCSTAWSNEHGPAAWICSLDVQHTCNYQFMEIRRHPRLYSGSSRSISIGAAYIVALLTFRSQRVRCCRHYRTNRWRATAREKKRCKALAALGSYVHMYRNSSFLWAIPYWPEKFLCSPQDGGCKLIKIIIQWHIFDGKPVNCYYFWPS